MSDKQFHLLIWVLLNIANLIRKSYRGENWVHFTEVHNEFQDECNRRMKEMGHERIVV